MISRFRLTMLLLPVVLSTGCGFFDANSASTFLLSVQDGIAYYGHFNEYSGFETLPSTTSALTLSDGTSKVIASEAVRYHTVVAGDYLVFERPTESGEKSQIVALPLNGGDEIVILDRNVTLGGRYYQPFAIDESQRVIALSGDGLLVFSLADKAKVRDIAVDKIITEVLAAGGGFAVLTGDDFDRNYLVNVTTGELRDLAMATDDNQELIPLLFDAVIDGGVLFTSAFAEASDGVQLEIIALDLATNSWKLVTQFHDIKRLPPFATAFVLGADADSLLVEQFTPFGGAELILVNRADGEQTVIAKKPDGLFTEPFNANWSNGRAYWISGDRLIELEPTSQKRTEYSLNSGS